MAESSHQRELEALEARLRETENKLKEKQLEPEDQARPSYNSRGSGNSPHRRAPLKDAFENPDGKDVEGDNDIPESTVMTDQRDKKLPRTPEVETGSLTPGSGLPVPGGFPS